MPSRSAAAAAVSGKKAPFPKKSFRRIVQNEVFLQRLHRAAQEGDESELERIVRRASAENLKAIAEILINLKHFPLSASEKFDFCTRRPAIKEYLKKKTPCLVRKSICIQRALPQRRKVSGEVTQKGGIWPLLGAIARFALPLLSFFKGSNNNNNNNNKTNGN